RRVSPASRSAAASPSSRWAPSSGPRTSCATTAPTGSGTLRSWERRHGVMPTAEVDGAQLAYKVDGQGPPLVLVHAGIADMRMWEPLVALLDHRFRVVRYDMRGHGETTYTAGESSDADDLAALLTALDIEACTLVGASFGGLVALDFAAKHPERVERLVVIDA